MTYFLLVSAGLLFAAQFCTDKYYQKFKPVTSASSVIYALFGKAAAAAVFLLCVVFGGNPLLGNAYTLTVGVIQAVLNLIIIVFGLRVLSDGSVAIYTVAMMIGGMALPAVFGICFLGDKITFLRVAAFLLIAAAVPLSAKGEKKKITPKAFLLYAALFVSNGAVGVFTALHANVWGADISYFTFMFDTSVAATLCYIPVAAAIALRTRAIQAEPAALPNPAKPASAILHRASPFVAGILNGAGNLLTVIGSASETGSAVTFPLVTGGTVLFGMIAAKLFYREPLGAGKCVSCALIVVALVLFAI